MEQFVQSVRHELPDRYETLHELDGRAIYALDVTYQKESLHYHPIYPMAGGVDNQKGHLLLTTYDLRKDVAINVGVETESMGEMSFVKERWASSFWTSKKKALYVVDRAFIDGYYWDERKKHHRTSVITRMKSTLTYEIKQMREFEPMSLMKESLKI